MEPRRPGAGRPQKENHNPNWAHDLSAASHTLTEQHEERTECVQQQHQLANADGRSWSYDECKLILTLVLGLMLQYGETPTDALHHASALIHRSYANLHALWRHWRHEQEIFVVDTHHRGAGAASHLHHAQHVSVDVIFYITEYIREANQTGGGCTSKALQDAVLAEHHTRLSDRVLRSVLSSMGFRYGRGNVIGKMNDPRYVARIRVFLVRYSKAVLEQQRGECGHRVTPTSRTSTRIMRHPPRGITQACRRRTTWCDRVARASVWCWCMLSPRTDGCLMTTRCTTAASMSSSRRVSSSTRRRRTMATTTTT